ncbi:MupA/Atu3671 family FMN-dependent luciferase-like monooxygenase [Kribbella sp. NPDC050820]|uniref:non-ribosomal peptide synthetase/type I polyketide synthase n=1 Tax=Kribbella sp. NPDC050820 TaxID=3155408 RepID=UPI0033E217AF
MPRTSMIHGPQPAPTAADSRDAVQALLRAAAEFPSAGVRTPAGLLTYPELLDRARRILTGLRTRGAASGHHVILHGLALDAFFPAFWACLLGGMRPAVISDPAASERLRHTWELLDSPLILTDRADLELPAVAIEDLGRLDPAEELYQPDPAEVAVVMLSSGSTGAPKAAALTHQALAEFAAGSRVLLDLRPGESMLNWLPVDHSGALLLYHVLPVFVGATGVHLPTADVLADPLFWLREVERHEVQHTWSPTFGLQLVADALSAGVSLDLGHVRSLVCGGEQIVLPVLDRFFAATAGSGLDRACLRPAWGMAETTTAITFGRLTDEGSVVRVLKSTLDSDLVTAGPDSDCLTFVAVGSPAPGASIRVVGENDEVLPELRIGRLQVRSNRVTAGYVNNASATASALPDGKWLRTGDLAFVSGGQVVITGREGDTVVVNGNTVFCHEIEGVAAEVGGVDFHAVGACGVPNAATGTEDLVVFVEADDAVAPAVKALIFERLRLTAEVVVVPAGDFPRTPSGKIRRNELRQRYLTGQYGAPNTATTPTAAPQATAVPRMPSTARTVLGESPDSPGPSVRAVAAEVSRFVAELAGQPTADDVPFYELGLTSIKITRLRAMLSEEFGIEVPATAPFEHPTAAALAAWLTEAQRVQPIVAVVADPDDADADGTDRRVAVVGMAARFPGARTVDEFWANLCRGVDSVSTGPGADGWVRAGGVLDDPEAFDTEFFGMSPKEAALTEPAHRQFLEVAHQALEHGGYAGPGSSALRTGVYAGSGMNLYGHQDLLPPASSNQPAAAVGDRSNVQPGDAVGDRSGNRAGDQLGDRLGGGPGDRLGDRVGGRAGDVATAMQATIGAAPDFLASRAAYRLGLTGPAIGVQTACSTSLVAVHLAVQALLASDTDLAIAGAAAVRLPQDAGYQYVPGSILSRTGRCRPFDAEADGTVGGNGVAAVLLKRLDRALADGDTIHAVILGSAVNNDGTSKVGFTAPSVSGQADVVRRALERSGVGADTISYVEAHGTGTALGDPIEFAALSQVFGSPDDRTANCGLGSVKANVGHLDSCAGMAGLIKTILMLSHAHLVPTLNLTSPHPDLHIEQSPFELITTTRPWPRTAAPRRAGVTALGVGGTNAHLILEEPPPAAVAPGATEPSAAVPASVTEPLADRATGMTESSEGARPAAQYGSVASSRGRAAGDGVAPEPVVVPVSATSPAALEELVGSLRERLVARPGLAASDVATTLALGRRHHQHRIAVVGTDASSLAAALVQATPTEPGKPSPLAFAYSGQGASYPGMSGWLAARFEAARKVFAEVTDVLGAEIVDMPGEELAQVSLFANQVAWTEVWRALGVRPDVVIGHSVGEYAALYAAGALSLTDGVRLTVRRGELMRTRMQPGAMIAVAADLATADKLAAECGLEVAAVNGPDRFVLAGSEDAVAGATEVLDRLGVSWRRMPVDRAFHSVMVEPVLDDLRAAAADSATFQPLQLPFFSGLDGSLLTHITSQYVVDHARRPVRFDLATTAAAELGATRFLELGPDTVLTPLGRRAAPGTTWLPTQRRDSTTQFPETVATLYRTGTTLTWHPLFTGHRIPLPGHPLTKRPIPTHPAVPLTSRTTTPPPSEPTDLPPALTEAASASAAAAVMPAPARAAVVPAPAETAAAPNPGGGATVPVPGGAGVLSAPGGAAVGQAHGEAGVVPASGGAVIPAAPRGGGVGHIPGGVGVVSGSGGAVDMPAPGGAGASPVAAGEGVLGTVRELIAPALGMVPDEIPADAPFLRLGADSLSLMRLVGDLTDTFGVTVSVRSLFSNVDTPAKLADLIANSTATPPQPQPNNTPPPATAAVPDAPAAGVVLAPPAAAVVPSAPAAGVVPGASGAGVVPAAPAAGVAPGVSGVGVVPIPAPISGPAGASSQVAAGASVAGGLQEVVERQLQVVERMMDRVSNLMSEQLAVLGGASDSGTRLSPPAQVASGEVAAGPVASGEVAAGPVASGGVASAEVGSGQGVSVQGARVQAAPVQGAPVQGARVQGVAGPGGAGVGGRGVGCDFSLYFFGDYPDSAAEDKYGLILGAVEFGDRRGFHSVWLPERHFHSFGALFPNPSVLAAALATRTERIRLNAGSVVLPLHHPIRVAEEWSVVDNLSGGRVGLCVASGWHARDFVLAPDAYGNHRTEMYDRLDTVRKLWAGEAITATAGNGEPTEVRLHPSPLQDEPPLFTAVVGNPESYKLAARNGLGVVTNLMAQSVEDLAANIALYRATRAEHGLDPDAGRVVVLLHTYVGDDLETVRAEAYQPFCDYLRSSLSLFGQVTNSLGFQIDLEKTAPDDVDFLLGQAYRRYCETRALIGTPETCRPIVDQLIAIGANELACFVDFGLGPDEVMRSLAAVDELRAEYVATERPADRALTPPEKRIWFLEQLNPGANTYHEPKAIELRGPLDPVALQGALQRVVDRHPALRTEFREVDGEPRAFVRTAVRVECPVVDAEGNDIESLLHDVRLGALDLDTAPLLRARLVRLADDHHVLLLVGHHIIFDSASTPIVVRDLGAYYRAWPADPGLPPAADGLPPAHNGMRPDSTAMDRDFWLDELADAPELRLPTDRPRPPTWSGTGRSLTHELNTNRLGEFAASSGVTVFSLLLAGLGLVLSRFSGQRDFVIGTGVSGRSRSAAESVGMFVDTYPLRVRLADDADFPALARSLGLSLMDAIDHGDVPFEDIVAELNPDRSTGRNPLFGVAVEFENAVDEIDFAPTVSVNLRDLPSNRAPVDLLLYLSYTPSGVRCVVEYNSDLYDESTVQRLLDYLELTLEVATAAPSVPLTALSELTAKDEQRLARFEGEPGPESTACLHELFEQRVDLHPDAIAIDGDFGQVTYDELDRRANRIAIELLSHGVRRGDLVGSCLPRGVDQLAVVLGVLKSGAGYLALDPAVPIERLRFQLNDSGATVLVTGEGMPDLGDLPTIVVDHLDPVAADRPHVKVTPDDLAYCFYTSGSSGTPKGVLMPHRGPVNNLLGFATHPLTTLQWASSMFDMSLHETFTTFITGQTLILIEDSSRYDAEQLARRIREHGIQRIVMPFSAVHALLATRPELPSLRVICSAGEATTPTAVEHAFLAAHPDCVLYNGYGPTETSIGVTDHPVEPGEKVPPIGRPLPGVRIRLLDPDRRPVPVGAVGEICIGGVCVANGYLNRPEETAKAFYEPGWYASGDLGRWRADGALEYLGRIDDQVQLRGVRVEPGEVRAAVQGHPAVTEAAVVVLDGELVGYTVGAVNPEELMEYLAARLPRYLVPRRWVSLERLPLTTTGKLDQAALPAPVAVEANVPPATPLESAVHAVWCEVLERAEIGVTDSFFDLGGHSLLAVRLLNRLRDATSIELTLSEFFRSPTIRGVAGGSEVAPVTVAQRRCLELVRRRADASIYNTPARVDIHEPLDPERLRRALERLVQRHSALRTRVLEDRQEVLASVEVALPVEDLPDDEDHIHAWCVATARPALEPSQAPLWRARLGRVSANRWVLVVAIHHIIFDGWSARLFWDELSALYGDAELAPPTAQYTDYARWEHGTLSGPTRGELDGFWRAELAGATVEPALPVDHPRPATLSGRGATHHVELPESLAKEVRTAAASAGTTPYVLIAAAFAEWLGALCGYDEVVLPVSSARRRQSGHEGIIGFIGEAVPVRIRLDTHDLLTETARALYSALDHEALPFAEILRQVLPDQTQAILFTVITTPPATLTLPTGSYPVRALPSPDLARRELYVVFTLTETSFTLDIEYSTDLFTPATITAWSTSLLEALADRSQV